VGGGEGRNLKTIHGSRLTAHGPRSTAHGLMVRLRMSVALLSKGEHIRIPLSSRKLLDSIENGRSGKREGPVRRNLVVYREAQKYLD